MRGLGGMTDAINALFASAGVSVPVWFFPALLGIGFAYLLPHIRQNRRTQQAREAIKTGAEEGGSAHPDFSKSVLSLAQGHPTTLLVIATEAHKRGLLGLSRDALMALESTGKYKGDCRRLRQQLDGPPPIHAEAEIAAIEKLVAQGLYGMAQVRIDRGRLHWPDRSDWADWETRMQVEE
jgi:hypothetical protein